MRPVSAALDLHDSSHHFQRDPTHPGFPATGLRKASFMIADWPVDVAESALERRRGCLRGQLAAEFLAWLDE